jgi:hypothetical protein
MGISSDLIFQIKRASDLAALHKGVDITLGLRFVEAVFGCELSDKVTVCFLTTTDPAPKTYPISLGFL